VHGTGDGAGDGGSGRELPLAEQAHEKRPPVWVVLARQGDRPDAILPLTKIPGWREVAPPPDFPTWTDDYSNIVRVLATR
jgi:hypothetical protein